ncbi:MAG: HNH endonuclease family protein [Candidatus Treponema excrementipullorum]|uniref:HNH endonuclease family protein n=1 Tax=Candidatus Treponema excrementipullorum TaxID=2838768 RepID=A0A9E2L1Z3_9SPIR|nr:HNH endonuclease family protein [Candidatus Treponema excrementipullorum]
MHNGFADSHLYLNQWIGTQKQWGAAELEQRGRTANLYQLPPAVAAFAERTDRKHLS